MIHEKFIFFCDDLGVFERLHKVIPTQSIAVQHSNRLVRETQLLIKIEGVQGVDFIHLVYYHSCIATAVNNSEQM